MVTGVPVAAASQVQNTGIGGKPLCPAITEC